MELKFKKIKSIKKIKRKTTVVNFSVAKNENYFANGILTHNCYMKRHLPEGLTIATNYDEILSNVKKHLDSLPDKQPNQTHQTFWTYDISCNEDFVLHIKYHKWQEIFDWFKNEPRALGSMATKYANKKLLSYNPNKKIRIRFSLMPEEYRKILEPFTSTISQRLELIVPLLEAGYEVHLNYSPVIARKGSGELYRKLFQQVAEAVPENYREEVKCEVIFLTHNKKKHKYNLLNNLPGEDLLWTPQYQESKTSQYGGANIRYKWQLKKKLIEQFKKIHNEEIPWNTIRYIF